MKKVLLLNEKYLKENSAVELNADPEMLKQTTVNVQNLQLRPVLGEELFNRLIDEVYAERVNNTAMSPALRLMLDDFIQPFLLYAIIVDYILLGSYRITNKGVLKPTEANASNPSTAELNHVKNYYEGYLNQYKERLVEHLYDSGLLVCNADTNTTSSTGGWYLPDSYSASPTSSQGLLGLENLDPVWSADKQFYYTKTDVDAKVTTINSSITSMQVEIDQLGATQDATFASMLSSNQNVAGVWSFNPTINASANNEVMNGLTVNPTFNAGAYTGTSSNFIKFGSAGYVGLGASNNLRLNSSSVMILDGALSTNIGKNTSTNTADSWVNIFSNGSSKAVASIYNNAGTRIMSALDSGNVLIQNGGTFTDSGDRLQVSGKAKFTDTLNVNKPFVASGNIATIGPTSTANFAFNFGSTSDFLVFAIGSGFLLKRNGGATPTIESNGGLNVTSSSFSLLGLSNNPADLRLTGSFGTANAKMGAYNTAASAIEFGNAYSTGGGAYQYKQTVYALNNIWQLTDSVTAVNVPTSAIFEIKTTTKGILLPRLTTAERDAIATPATGLIIYNTTTNALNAYFGGSWKAAAFA